MSAVTFVMPNEGYLGGFDIRRFVQKYMSIGLAISIGIHASAIGTYYFVVSLHGREAPLEGHVVPFNPGDWEQPPSIAKPDLPPMVTITLPELAAIAAIPKPVVREVSPEEPQIKSQEELVRSLPTIPDEVLDQVGRGGEIRIVGTIPEEQDVSQAPKFVAFEQAPQVVKRVEPVYPKMAAIAEVNGSVVVQFYVDKKGNVGKILIKEVDPKGMGFEEAAMEAVAQWKFTPALQRENPVGVWVWNKFTFKIK